MAQGDNIQYSVGVDDLLIAFKTKKETSNTAPEYDKTIYRLPTIKKLGVKGNGKAVEVWGSSKLFAKVSQETTHTLSLDMIGIPINVYDRMTGYQLRDGLSFAGARAHEFPEFALGIIANRSDNVKDAIWYPNCSLNPATTKDYETAEEAFKEQDGKLELSGTALGNNGIIFSHFNSARGNGIKFEDFIKASIFDPKTPPNPPKP